MAANNYGEIAENYIPMKSVHCMHVHAWLCIHALALYIETQTVINLLSIGAEIFAKEVDPDHFREVAGVNSDIQLKESA